MCPVPSVAHSACLPSYFLASVAWQLRAAFGRDRGESSEHVATSTSTCAALFGWPRQIENRAAAGVKRKATAADSGTAGEGRRLGNAHAAEVVAGARSV